MFLEIGAGSGELTVPLAKSTIDSNSWPSSRNPTLPTGFGEASRAEKLQQVEVIEADFLSLDLADFLTERDLATGARGRKPTLFNSLPHAPEATRHSEPPRRI